MRHQIGARRIVRCGRIILKNVRLYVHLHSQGGTLARSLAHAATRDTRLRLRGHTPHTHTRDTAHTLYSFMHWIPPF